jgi:hypothetical protein
LSSRAGNDLEVQGMSMQTEPAAQAQAIEGLREETSVAIGAVAGALALATSRVGAADVTS